MNKVLIVDDEPKIRTILTRLLKDEGYSVAEAESGEKALEIARCFRPDVILMDIVMPRMNGIETMSAIGRILPTSKTIMMTAYGSNEISNDAMEKGAYDYLTKPFDNNKLLHLVRRALATASNQKGRERLAAKED
ncbi:MAG: sigma-54-dependent transcriptional regulator [bacterium]